MRLLLLFLLNCTSSEKKIKIGISPDYPPFEFSEKGALKGFDVDLAYLLEKKLNKKITFVQLEFNALIPSLLQGKIDMIISSLSKTIQREQSISFSIPYYFPAFSILIKKIPYNTIGVQIGSTMEYFLKQDSHGLSFQKLKILPNNQVLFQELVNGRIDALMLEYSQGKTYLKQHPELQLIKLIQKTQGYSIGFKKKFYLEESINTILRSEENVIKKLQQKWFKDEF